MWLTLRVMGPAALGDAFDTLIELTQAAHERLTAHPAIEVLHAPELTTQIFRYVPGKMPATHRSTKSTPLSVKRSSAPVTQ